jgi:hypothetical protein
MPAVQVIIRLRGASGFFASSEHGAGFTAASGAELTGMPLPQVSALGPALNTGTTAAPGALYTQFSCEPCNTGTPDWMFPGPGRIVPSALYRVNPVGIDGRLAPWNVTRASIGVVSYPTLVPPRITVVPLPVTSQAGSWA